MASPKTADDAGIETVSADLKGRVVVLKSPTAGQFGIMAQQVRIMQGPDRDRAVRAIGLTMDVMQHLFAPEDQDYVIDLMVRAEIDVPEVMALLELFKSEEPAGAAKASKPRRAR